MRHFLLNKPFVLAMVFWSLVLGTAPPSGWAMPTGSAAAFAPAQSFREAAVDKIIVALSRPEARAHLALMGLDEKELRQKLSRLDDRELAQVAAEAETVRAGGDALGVVVVLLVIVLLAVLIFKLADKTVEIKDEK